MRIFFLLSLIIFSATDVLSQSSFYYYKGNRIPLNENPNVRYVSFNKQLSEEDVSLITGQLEEFCWRVDAYDSRFKKYYINQNDLDNFLGVVSRNNSNILLHTPNYATSDTVSFYPVRQVLVKSKHNISLDYLLTYLNIPFESIIQNQYNPDYYNIILSSDDAVSVAATLYETGYFDYAEPDFVFPCSLLGYEDNPMYYEQWAIHNDSVNINLIPAWGISTGDQSVKVAVLDVGVDLDHEDLLANLLDGYDAVVDDIATYATNGNIENTMDLHGTWCAGVIVAENNDICSIGVAHSSRIIPVRVGYTAKINTKDINPPGETHWESRMRTSWFIDGLFHACYEDTADIVNCSLSFGDGTDALEKAIEDVTINGREGKGCIVVVASGNTYKQPTSIIRDTLHALARYPNVIATGSITPCGKRVEYGYICGDTSNYNSCYGDSLDVVAPGIGIPTTSIYDNCTDFFTGTSSAAPHVAGVAALVLSVNPCLTMEEVKYVIESTCTKIRPDLYDYTTNPNHPNGSWNMEVGYGLVNAYAAVQLAQQMGGYTYIKDTIVTGNVTWAGNKMIHGKLVVDGGTLTSACAGEMWQGSFNYEREIRKEKLRKMFTNIKCWNVWTQNFASLHGASLYGGTTVITMQNIPAGVYILTAIDVNGVVYHQKIIKK